MIDLDVITHLTRRHVPLAEIKERLDGLRTEELRRLVEEERRQTEDLKRAERAPSPRSYIAALLQQARLRSSVGAADAPGNSGRGAARFRRTGSEPDASRRRGQAWRRWEIAPGVELHASDVGERRYRTLIKRLLQVARATRYHSVPPLAPIHA